jgi:hypothetical protein
MVTANGQPFRPFDCGGHSSRADGPGYLNGWAFGPNRSNSSNENPSQRCRKGYQKVAGGQRSVTMVRFSATTGYSLTSFQD